MFTLLVAIAGVAPAQPPALTFTAGRASDPQPVSGTVAKIGPGFAVDFTGATPAVGAGDLLSLARTDKPRPAYPAGPHVVLANGDRLGGTVSGGNGLSVTLRTAFGNGQAVSLPLAAVAAVWVVSPPADAPPDVARYPWVDAGKKRDALLLRNGDRLHGRLEAVAADGAGLRFKPDGEKAAKPYAISTVAALALDPTLARVRTPKGPFARLTLADGSRVSMATLLSDGGVLTGATVTGAKVSVPMGELITADIRRGKAVELADLKPTAVKEDGFNGVVWPWVANRSVRGKPLRLTTARGVEVFDSGLGVHSRSSMTYKLAGKYKRFEAAVGLDAVSGARGAVDVRVLVDGQDAKLDGLTGLTASAGAKAIRVDVSGAKELTLVVDYGPGGDVQDDVNWGNARLVE